MRAAAFVFFFLLGLRKKECRRGVRVGAVVVGVGLVVLVLLLLVGAFAFAAFFAACILALRLSLWCDSCIGLKCLVLASVWIRVLVLSAVTLRLHLSLSRARVISASQLSVCGTSARMSPSWGLS